MAGNDFVDVRLTTAGEALAGGTELRITARTSIVFKPGESVHVARYEWDLMLRNYHGANDVQLFELVPVATPEDADKKESE